MSPRHPFSRHGGPAARAGAMRSLARLAVLAPIGLTSALLAAEGDGPAARTQPAAARPGAEARRVVVLQFAADSKNASTDNLGAAVQRGLASELSSSAGLTATATPSSAPEPQEFESAARTAVREGGARYAVFGSVQSVNGQVRINGQVYDVQTNRTVAPLKATGPASDFFAVQDDFARQAQAALGVTTGGAAGGAAGSPSGRSAGSTANADSHWAGYEDFYQAARSAPAGNYPPPMPPPPPLYGGGFGGGYGYGYGGGFYDGYGYPFYNSGVVGNGNGFQSGNVSNGRGFVLGSAGVSTAPPPPTAFNTVRSASAGSFLPGSPPRTPIPPYAGPVQDYRGPFYRFPSPVGQPQRAAPPNLRPGATAAPAAARPAG